MTLLLGKKAEGPGRKPPWLKMKMPGGEEFARLLKLVNEQRSGVCGVRR